MPAPIGPLLATKLLVPPDAGQTLPRPELLALLNRPGARLLLLAAPAGFGKTTVLAAWCHALMAAGVGVAWLTLEEAENDLPRFLAYLCAALAPLAGAEGEPALAAGDSDGLLFEPLLAPLLNALTASERQALLVLDDLHQIHAPAVHAALSFLLEHLPPRLRLAIASRADPPLALARLRSRGELVELRAAELRFTEAEQASFFQAVIPGLAADEGVALAASSGGWPAGCRLVALAQANARRPMAARLAESRAHLFDLLAEELFDDLPAEQQDLLLQTAILDRLCGPLCDAVLDRPPDAPRSAGTLDELAHANLFVSALDAERQWYRVGQPFRDFLLARLQRDGSPERSAELHRRAAGWYAGAGALEPAVEHALAAGDGAQAAGLIDAAAVPLVARGEYRLLRRWLGQLGDELRDQHPALWLWEAWTALLTGAVELVEPALGRAEGRWQDERWRGRRGEVAHLRAHLARLRDDGPGTVAAATQALSDLTPEAATLRAGSLLALGCGQLRCGDREAARTTLEAALEQCRAHNFLGSLVALVALGDLERERGDPEAAERCYRGALDCAGTRPLWEVLTAQLARAALLLERGDSATAIALLRPTLTSAEQAGVAVYFAHGYLLLGQALTGHGEPVAAHVALDRAEELAARLGNTKLMRQCAGERAHLGACQPVRLRVCANGAPMVEELSAREREVLALVARGASNQQIAEQLVVSLGTVKCHLNHILGKLGARSRTEAVACARDQGLLAR